jgi:NAD(P)-dependent dehydrogenase (short-subunit alcohol dehydrogenase family)
MPQDDRVALVTGASKGLGRSIAMTLARRGWDLVLVARSPDELDDLAERIREYGRKVLAVPADVTRAEDVRRAAQVVETGFPRLDLLVNNAGIEQNAPIAALPEAALDALLDTNVKGVVLAIQAFLPLLKKTKGASVVNLASAAGLVGMPGAAVYGATKAAVIHLTKALAVEWRPLGIRSNSVCPGFIDTEMARKGLEFFRQAGFPIDLLVGYRQGRLGTPDEVAEAVAWLASPEAAFVNGHALAVDGAASVS